jgi:hypothetical protein
MQRASFAEILRLLAENDVEVIVVGMLAGVLQGAPLTTADVDVVHRRTPENVARLLKVLEGIRAVYRGDPRRLRPTESHLLGAGHQLLETDLGDLDCLGTVDNGRGYEDLLSSTVSLELSPGKSIHLIDLATLIEVKRRAGRPKDLAAIPVLESTLEERLRSR